MSRPKIYILRVCDENLSSNVNLNTGPLYSPGWKGRLTFIYLSTNIAAVAQRVHQEIIEFEHKLWDDLKWTKAEDTESYGDDVVVWERSEDGEGENIDVYMWLTRANQGDLDDIVGHMGGEWKDGVGGWEVENGRWSWTM